MDGKPPERIWLVWPDAPEVESYNDLKGVMWEGSSVNETDVEYVPAASLSELERELRDWKLISETTRVEVVARGKRIADQDREIAEYRAALTLTHDVLFRLDKLISFNTVPLDLQDKLVHAVRAAEIKLHEEEASDR